MMSYENAARQQLHRRWWLRAVGVMACIVVFITVYALVLPAITMEGNPTCGLEEHEHMEDCYTADGVLICQLEEHTHDAACYAEAEEGELAEPDAEAEDADLVAPPVDAEADPAEETDAAEPEDDLVTLGALPMARVLAAGTDGSLMDGVDTDGANDWQIVSGGYEGNAASNKTLSADGNVRVQKNVIPTDTENEFLVYLSIDTRDEKVVTETEITEYLYLDTTHYIAHTSNNYNHGYGNDYTGHYLPRDMSSSTTTWHPGASAANKNIALRLWHDGEVIAVIQGYTGMSNGSFVLEMPGQTEPKHQVGLGIMSQAKTEVIDGVSMKVIDVPLQDDVYEDLIRVVKESSVAENSVSLQSVTDVMGAHITDFSYVAGDGNAEPSADGKTITWNITPKSNPEQETTTDSTSGDGSSTETTTTWNLNVAELVYRVKLDVTADGFVSGANEDVNQSATLNYTYSGDDRTDDFPVPVVKGLLYDIVGLKVDQKTQQPLANATFKLTPDGTVTATSDENGAFSFTGLPWGEYSVTETEAPKGYKLDEHTATFNLCYTTNKDALTVSSLDSTHMMASDTDTFKFEDQYNQPTIVLMKCDEDGDPLKDASFTITSTGGLSIDATSVASGEITTITDAENGTYTVTETQAPDGYNLLSDALTIEVNGADDVTAKLGSARLDEPTITKTVDEDSGITIYTILIYNNSGAVLPATGGPGTVVFTVSGLALMAAAMILLSKQRKRNHA